MGASNSRRSTSISSRQDLLDQPDAELPVGPADARAAALAGLGGDQLGACLEIIWMQSTHRIGLSRSDRSLSLKPTSLMTVNSPASLRM